MGVGMRSARALKRSLVFPVDDYLLQYNSAGFEPFFQQPLHSDV